MPFVPSFSVSQGVDVTSFTIQDTSTGTDTNIVSRDVYLYKSDGTTLTPQGSTTPYISFPLTQNNTLILTGILQIDYCLNIVINWVDINNNVLYTANGLYLFTGNSENFYYGLTVKQSITPNIITNTYFYNNKLKLRVEIDSATQALSKSDQVAAQQCLNRALILINNKYQYF